jgi:hypothetical protein
VPEFDLSTTPAFAATDMLHRRTLLPYAFVAWPGALSIAVRTNDAAIAHAFVKENGGHRVASAISGSEWLIEIAVTDSLARDSGLEHWMGDAEFFSFGSSRSIRFANGSWFARTPPSGDGVGFAWISGDADRQQRQFGDFLRIVALSVFGEDACPRRLEAIEEVA